MPLATIRRIPMVTPLLDLGAAAPTNGGAKIARLSPRFPKLEPGQNLNDDDLRALGTMLFWLQRNLQDNERQYLLLGKNETPIFVRAGEIEPPQIPQIRNGQLTHDDQVPFRLTLFAFMRAVLSIEGGMRWLCNLTREQTLVYLADLVTDFCYQEIKEGSFELRSHRDHMVEIGGHQYCFRKSSWVEIRETCFKLGLMPRHARALNLLGWYLRDRVEGLSPKVVTASTPLKKVEQMARRGRVNIPKPLAEAWLNLFTPSKGRVTAFTLADGRKISALGVHTNQYVLGDYLTAPLTLSGQFVVNNLRIASVVIKSGEEGKQVLLPEGVEFELAPLEPLQAGGITARKGFFAWDQIASIEITSATEPRTMLCKPARTEEVIVDFSI